MLQLFRPERPAPPLDAIDHPAIARMSLRELADLPLPRSLPLEIPPVEPDQQDRPEHRADKAG